MVKIKVYLENIDTIEDMKLESFDLNHLENRMKLSGLLGHPQSNITLQIKTRKIQHEVHKKMSELFDEMQSNNLQNELKKFYLKGGKRKYSIVVSKWRSGSSFFGDFLQSVPGSFYSYEPLINKHDIFKKKRVPLGLSRISRFLQCDYSDAPDYFKFISRHPHGFRMVSRLHDDVVNEMSVVFEEEYINSLCNIYPFQSMKILKLELSQFKSLLDNNNLDFKMVLLVRDPRAVMNSRKNIGWCLSTYSCRNVKVTCDMMVRDYHTARDFVRKYPDHLRIVRYEDFLRNIMTIGKTLLDFYGLPITNKTLNFLKLHTTTDDSKHHYSTFRDSTHQIGHWRSDLKYQQVKAIQDECFEAMKMWKYYPVNETEYDSGNFSAVLPLTDFPS